MITKWRNVSYRLICVNGVELYIHTIPLSGVAIGTCDIRRAVICYETSSYLSSTCCFHSFHITHIFLVHCLCLINIYFIFEYRPRYQLENRLTNNLHLQSQNAIKVLKSRDIISQEVVEYIEGC